MKEVKQFSNLLTQNYTNVTQDLYCGHEPIVRFIEFAFDKSDSLTINIDITTSSSEQKINGEVTIMIDSFELEYANIPISKQYLETLEIESNGRYPVHARGRISLANILITSASKKSIRKDSQKQYWNTVSIKIEPEDELLIQNSNDIYFVIPTHKCDLIVYPSYSQVDEIKQFLTNRKANNSK